MSFVKGSLTIEQQKRINDNRKKALERLKQRGLASNASHLSSSSTHTSQSINNQSLRSLSRPNTSFNQIKNVHATLKEHSTNQVASDPTGARVPSNASVSTVDSVRYVKPNLSPEQKALIERNRQRALEIQKFRSLNAGKVGADVASDSAPQKFTAESSAKISKVVKRPLDSLRPSIKKKDYIDYDFSTMQDTRGGFISADPTGPQDSRGETLEDWKEKQKVIREPAPPIDPKSLPKCFECESAEIDLRLFQTFGCRVCKTCREKMPHKYSLLTKTECREDYLLTDPELRDVSLLPRLEKPNPYGGTYSRMQLFLRFQVEEFAYKKWGSEEGLDKEWERREEQRVSRRDKKYEMKMREMRKKTRAEEYTRKLREGHQIHVHQWSQPVEIKNGDEAGLVKRRCMDCGLETEEFLM